MSGLNRNAMVAGMMAALAAPAAGVEIGIKRHFDDSTPSLNFGGFGRNRGKGRNKNPRRFTGVAAVKRESIKARNRRRK